MRITRLCRYKRAIIIASGAIALLVALSWPGLADEVVISCTGSLRGDVTGGEYSCVGGVRITDKQMEITGESLLYSRKNNTIHVQGDVRFKQAGIIMSGRDLIYNMDDDTGNMQVVTMSDTPEGALSPVYMQSDSVSACREHYVLNGARLTTCDPVAPGYYLAAKTIEVYAQDRIVLYNVRFIESGITLYYWPKLVFSLKRKTDQQTAEAGTLIGVELPRVGQSATEGWFIKTTYGYRGPGNQYGKILLDYMTLLGWGVGINHTLRADTNGQQAFALYLQPNKATGHLDVQASITQQSEFGGIKLKTDSNFTSTYAKVGGEQRRLYGNISLNRNTQNGSTAFNWAGTQLAGGYSGYDVSSTFHYNNSFSSGWQLSLDSSLQRRQRTDMTDRHLASYVVKVARQTADYNFTLGIDDRFHPDLTQEIPPDVSWNRISRLPELKLQLHRLAIGGYNLPFTFTAGYGNYVEYRPSGDSNKRFTASRQQVGISVKPLQLELGRWGQFSWNGTLTRSMYSTGQMQWFADAQSTYRLVLTNNLSLSADYHYNDLFGDFSPFFFDRVAVGERVQGRIDLQTKVLNGSVSAGYDILHQVPLDVVVNANIASGSLTRLQAQAAYSPLAGVWVYGIGTVELKTKRFNLNLGTKVDLKQLQLERLDVAANWDLDSWKVGYAGIYNAIIGKFDRGDITLTRDLGCRSIELRYNQPNKEIWLEYHITAFPQANVKLGANEKKLLFDLKSWEALITKGGS